MADPKIASRTPFILDVQPGTYAWCACGHSKSQPYCDGSHQGTGMVPQIEKIVRARKVAWCGCKHSSHQAFCDGSHVNLPE